MSYLTANDAAILADLADGVGGFSIGPEIPYDPVGMAWANGRRCTDWVDNGLNDTSIPLPTWADGTPVKGPYTPAEWRAAKAEHGLVVRRPRTDSVGGA